MRKHNLMRDLSIIIIGIVVAIIFVKSGMLSRVLESTKEIKFFGSFVSGIFFTSVFTAVPATFIFAELAKTDSIFWVSILGGFGALFGDFIIFRFVRDNLSRDFLYLIKKTKSGRFFSIFKIKFFGWIVPFFGALIIASPLPDEIGLAMMGLSKMKIYLFVPLSFLLNSIGILIICLITKSI